MWHAPVQWGRVTERVDRVIIIGSGPSVNQLDRSLISEAQQSGVFVIVVNGAATQFPEADAWFTLDPHSLATRLTPIRGNKWYVAIPDDFGIPLCRFPALRDPPPQQATYLHRLVGNEAGSLCAKFGLSEDPSAIYTGNSAYGALGLAYLMGARHIALLGVDGTTGYFYGETLPSGNLRHLPQLFESAIPQLTTRGVVVLNGSPHSAVTCFPRMTPNQAVCELIQCQPPLFTSLAY